MIDAAGSGSGIFIGNTTSSFFEIRNVRIINAAGAAHGPYDQGAGITLYRAEKGTIVNSNISSNLIGIAIIGGGDIRVAQCSFYENNIGINVSDEQGAPYANPTSVTIYRNSFTSSFASGAAIKASSATWLNIDGNKFRSSGTPDGILLSNCSVGTVVEDNDLRGLPGVGITLRICDNTTVRNNNVTGVGATGIAVIGDAITSPLRNIVIDGNDCSGAGLSGISVDAGARPIIGMTISDNICNGNQYGIQAIFNGASHTNTVERNTCNANLVAGIDLVDFQLGLISHNTCQYNQDGATGGSGLVLAASTPLPVVGTTNNLIVNNVLSHNKYPLQVGVANDNNTIDANDCSYGMVDIMVQSSGNTVTNNILYNYDAPGYNDHGALTGLSVSGPGVSNNLVAGNVISLPDDIAWGTDASTANGIEIKGSPLDPAINNIVEYNQVMFCSGIGIWMDRAAGNQVLGNTIMGMGVGIALSSSTAITVQGNSIYQYLGPMAEGVMLVGSIDNVIVENQISGLDGVGVVVTSSSDSNVITNNWVSNCGGYAISISGSVANSIFLNAFQNNNPLGTAQGYSDQEAGTNSWSSGAIPDQGNYWSDWTSPDATNDGYVDDPYTLDGPAITPETDARPLTFAVGPVHSLVETHGFSTVSLEWTAPEYSTYGAVTSYNIYRDSFASIYATVPAGSTHFIDTAVLPEETHTYWVNATVLGEENIMSPSVTATLPALVGVNPMDFSIGPLSAVQTTGDVTVTWTPTDDPTTTYWLSLDNFITTASTTLNTYTFTGLADSPFGQPYTLYIMAINDANEFEVKSVQFSVDTAGPIIISNLGYQNVFASGTVPFNFYIWEDVGVGVINDTVYLDGVLLWDSSYTATSYVEYGYPTPIDLGFPTNLTGGMHTVTIFSEDAAAHLSVATFTFLVDDAAPVLSVISDLGSNNITRLPETTFTWVNSVDPVFPTQDLSFLVKVDDGAWRSVGIATSFTTATLPDGQHTFRLKGVDMAGHESVAAFTFTLDSVGPVVTSLTPVDGTSMLDGVVDLAWTATDGDGLGIVSHAYKLDGQAAVSIISAVNAQTATLSNVPTGTHTIKVWAVDAAGNIGPAQTIHITMDGDPPVTTAAVSGVAGTNGWYTSAVSVTLTAVDVGSGVAKTQYRFGTTGPWSDYTVPLSISAQGETVLQFNSTDNFGMAEATKTVIVKIDTAAPTTTPVMQGTLGAGGYYTTPVVVNLTAVDATSGVGAIEYDLDGSGWLAYTGNLTVSSPGSHTILYRAVDVAGNTETESSVTFDIDGAGPVTTAAYSGASGLNGWNTSAVSVTLSATDPTSGVASIWYRINGGDWIEYLSTILLSSEGVNVIEYNATDMAGNHEATHTLSFNIDTVAPSTTADLQGGIGLLSWYHTPVVVSLTSIDPTSGVGTIQYDLDGAGWATYHSSLTVLSSGNHTLAFRATDRAGNLEATQWANFSIDVVAPTSTSALSGGTGENGWNITDVTIVLAASDDMSGVRNITYRINGGSWATYSAPIVLTTEWINIVEYYTTDMAGNVESMRTVVVKIDKSAPTTTAQLAGTAGTTGWYLSSVTATLIPADPFSGPASTWYRLDGSGDFVAYSGPILIEGEGAHSLEYYSIDLAGNVESSRWANFSIDTTIPEASSEVTGTGGLEGWYTSQVKVNLTATDAISGVGGIMYRVNGQEWSRYSVNLTLAADGTYTIEFYALDVSGNMGATGTLEIKVDRTAPTTEATLHGTSGLAGWNTSAVTVTLVPYDGASGVNRTQYRLSGEGTWTNYTEALLFDADGTYLLEFRSVDDAGNTEATRTIAIWIDTTAPSLELTGPAEGSYHASGTVTASWASADSGSGLSGFAIRVDGGSWSSLGATINSYILNLPEGEHVISVMAIDAAGNSAVQSVGITVDTTAPVVEEHSPVNGGVARGVNVTVTFSELMNQTATTITINGVLGTVSWDGVNATFTPQALLIYNTTYTVTISGRDLAGNSLTYEWSFSTIAGKGTISGVVVDKDGKPVAGAIVSLGTGLNTTTDSEGRYSLNVTQGSYTMVITASGMEDKVMTILVVPDQTSDAGSITLSKVPSLWTDLLPWLIVVVIAVILVGAFLFVRRRKA